MQNSPTKTIVFFNSNKAWGGGEKWHLTTCREFRRRGFKTILVTNEASELAKKGIKDGEDVYRFRIGNLSFLNPIKIFVFFLFFKLKSVDAVVMNLPADLKVAGIAAKLAGVKHIVYRRGMPHPLRNTFLNRFLFTKVLSHVVVNSQEIGRSLKEGNEAWFPEEKVVLIYNGVDSNQSPDKSKKIYEKEGDELVIGNAGRLTEQKGQKYLIEVGKRLKDEGKKFKILIAGEGELKGELAKMISENSLSDHVKLLGHVTDMAAFFNSLDVFVFTSLYEGSANTLIETLHFGVPTIAWDVSSNPEIILHGETGFLAKPFEIESLFQSIKYVQSADLEKIRARGRAFVAERFDSQKNLGILEGVLKVK
jgi:glycosyltransferase involved in cell wall biosynthesis